VVNVKEFGQAAPGFRPAYAVNKRVLVVDDQPRVTRFVEIYLKQRGFDVICANSGRQALDMVKSRKPDLLVLDIAMPGMDGLEVMTRLRCFSQIPVIAVSASPECHIEAAAAGAADFLPKPFQMQKVLERINQLLGL
jgi:two-component system, OmpR family, KDP operon response regulator KdpE